MKKIVLYLFVFYFLGCSKKQEPEKVVTFEVQEYKVNTPIPGVSIALYKCSRPDIEFGCLEKQKFKTVITDVNGKATVSAAEYNIANEGIFFSKSGYWATEGGGDRVIYLNRVGKVAATILVGQTFPTGALLSISVKNDLESFTALEPIPVPDMTTNIMIKGIAGQVNAFHWQVYRHGVYYNDILASGDIADITVPINGTGNITITL